MYALPRTPALHGSPVLNSYFEHALTTSTRILPSARMASTSAPSAYTVSSPKNTSTSVFRTTNRPGTPLYTPPLCNTSYFPTLATVHDKPASTPHNTPFFTSFNTFTASPKNNVSRFEGSPRQTQLEPVEELSSSLAGLGLGLGIGNLLEPESSVFTTTAVNASYTRKRAARPSFAHRISNMPLPELTLPKMRRAESTLSTGSAGSEMTVMGGDNLGVTQSQADSNRPGHIRWDSAIVNLRGSTMRKGTPHPGKMAWIEDGETALA